MSIEQVKESIQQLTNEEVDQLGVWIYGDEMNRRATLKAVEEAAAKQRAEDASALWEAHPDLKPTVVEAPKEPVAATVEEAATKVDIEAYKAPTGAHDSYPKGAKFIYKGRVWESLMDGYCWEPDAPGIDERFVVDVTDRFVKTTGEEPKAPEPAVEQPTAPEYRQPSGGHDAYKQGDRVTYKGQAYESTINGNVWAPDAYPQGWKKLA